MASILVVDDSAADREMAGHLLEQASWRVLYAEHGRDALARMRVHAVDLVLTDVVMPELDGLAFVEHAKVDHPLVPVVLMTARGSEELAARALEAGAASYVPKKLLVRDLVEVVRRMLDVFRERKSDTRLLGHLRAATFVLENDLDMLSALVSYLTRILRDSGRFDESECHRLSTALDEALTNACYHGNLEVRSAIREHDARAYRALARERRLAAPWRDRRIHVSMGFESDAVRFVVRDEGRGFDVADVRDPTRPEQLERPTGRGIFLMKTFVDDVRYNATGNQVTLLKRG